MYIDLDIFCFSITLTMLLASVLYIATGVGGCEWHVSARAVLTDVNFWQFSNSTPNYSFMTDAMTLLMMLNTT